MILQGQSSKWLRICGVIGLIVLFTGLPIAFGQDKNQAVWIAYDADQIDGKVIEGANPTGPLPANCPLLPVKDKYIIALSQASRDRDPWRELMDEEIADTSQKYPELSVIFADARNNYTKQIADVQQFLTLGIDLLIISPAESAPLTDVIEQVYKRCIPVIVLDRAMNGDQFSMFVGANNVAIGQAAGEFAAHWCATMDRSPCTILELRGLAGTPPARDRGDGFRLGIANNPALKIIDSQTADYLRELALEHATQMFRDHPDADVVYAHNDSMAEAAIVAAQNTKRDLSKLLFIGIDGLPTDEGGIASVLQKRIGATYIYPTGGKQAVEWASQILISHINPPHKLELSFQEVTPDNALQLCDLYHCSWSPNP